MNNRLLIIGASGHGKVVADIAIKMNKWQVIAFLDDDESIKTSIGLEVIGKIEDALKYKDEADFFVAIGNNSVRQNVQEWLISNGLSIVKVVHPNAVISSGVDIGIGTVVMAGVVINCSSVIGMGCIINTSCSLDHDNIIEDFVHISPGSHLAGKVTVGKGSWLGIGSIVSNNISIATGCKLGAGVVVVKDINETGTYVGVPARKIELKDIMGNIK